MIDNNRLENELPFPEWVEISNHALKGMIEANSWKKKIR